MARRPGVHKGRPDIKGIARSEETRRKMSERRKGRPGHSKGKKQPPRTEEHKRTLSEAHKGKRAVGET